MSDDKFPATLQTAACEIDPLLLADAAAQEKMVVNAVGFHLKDKANPEIIVGHALVVVAYGHEQCVQQLTEHIKKL